MTWILRRNSFCFCEFCFLPASIFCCVCCYWLVFLVSLVGLFLVWFAWFACYAYSLSSCRALRTLIILLEALLCSLDLFAALLLASVRKLLDSVLIVCVYHGAGWVVCSLVCATWLLWVNAAWCVLLAPWLCILLPRCVYAACLLDTCNVLAICDVSLCLLLPGRYFTCLLRAGILRSIVVSRSRPPLYSFCFTQLLNTPILRTIASCTNFSEPFC